MVSFSFSVVNDRWEIRGGLICVLWSGRSEVEIALIVSLSGVQVWNLQSSRVVAVVCESIQERGRDEGREIYYLEKVRTSLVWGTLGNVKVDLLSFQYLSYLPTYLPHLC